MALASCPARHGQQRSFRRILQVLSLALASAAGQPGGSVQDAVASVQSPIRVRTQACLPLRVGWMSQVVARVVA